MVVSTDIHKPRVADELHFRCTNLLEKHRSELGLHLQLVAMRWNDRTLL
jgi:hypothetical protein